VCACVCVRMCAFVRLGVYVLGDNCVVKVRGEVGHVCGEGEPFGEMGGELLVALLWGEC